MKIGSCIFKATSTDQWVNHAQLPHRCLGVTWHYSVTRPTGEFNKAKWGGRNCQIIALTLCQISWHSQPLQHNMTLSCWAWYDLDATSILSRMLFSSQKVLTLWHWCLECFNHYENNVNMTFTKYTENNITNIMSVEVLFCLDPINMWQSNQLWATFKKHVHALKWALKVSTYLSMYG